MGKEQTITIQDEGINGQFIVETHISFRQLKNSKVSRKKDRDIVSLSRQIQAQPNHVLPNLVQSQTKMVKSFPS